MKILLVLSFYVISSFIYSGFLLHKSPKPQIGPYSLGYAAILVVLATVFLIPPVIRSFLKRYGTRTLMFSLFPVFILLGAAYFISGLYYYYSQTHYFDPYLQIHPAQPRFEKKSPNTFRILTMGGSTTRNGRLAENDRYPRVLEELLQKSHPEFNIDVFNAGTDWYTTKHALINYVTNLRAWDPDLVIVMHAVNDLYRSFSDPDFAIKPYNRLWSHYYGPSIKGADPPTFEEHILRRPARFWFSAIRHQERNIPLARYVSLRDFDRYLRSLVHCLKSDKVKIILMTQPYLYKENMSHEELSVLWFGRLFCKERVNAFQYQYPSATSLRIAMDSFNDKVKKCSSDEKVLLVDLESATEKNLANFVDDVHYTPRGAYQIAKKVAAKINQEGLIANHNPAANTPVTSIEPRVAEGNAIQVDPRSKL